MNRSVLTRRRALTGFGALSFGCAHRAPTPGGSFRAAVGFSAAADVGEAARGAASQMLASLDGPPEAVLFLERTGSTTAADGRRVGDLVRAAVRAPTYGHGGTGTYGLTWGTARDGQPSFLVLGLRGVRVRAHALPGAPAYTYDKAVPVEVKQQMRRLCRARGRELGQQVARDARLAILLGALHNSWHVTFAEGMRDVMPPGLPLVGGVGKFEDYVYLDGRPLGRGAATDVGQIVVTLSGDLEVRLAGKTCADTRNPAAVWADTERVMARATADLRRTPRLALAFSCVTRLRAGGGTDPTIDERQIRRGLPAATPLFGALCGGELGLDLEGRFSAGGDRLMVALIG